MAAALIGATAHIIAQGATEPYKLGMFRQGDRTFVGLVLKDPVVLELAKAGVTAPATLKELIARWDAPMANRLATDRGRRGEADAGLRAAALRRENAAADHQSVGDAEHGRELSGTRQRDEPRRRVHAVERRRSEGAAGHPRHVGPQAQRSAPQPVFLSRRCPAPSPATATRSSCRPVAPRSTGSASSPVVIGKPAKNVSARQAADYIFGYTLENDVSDRGGRADARHGSDWLIGKSHDTFAPLGPFIVPKQFVPNPQKLGLKFTLSGKVMQDSNTDRMTHTVAEVVEFASRILTLQPGDILATGSPAGVGTARATPIYFKDGDTSVCTIESIGTLTNPIRAEREGRRF